MTGRGDAGDRVRWERVLLSGSYAVRGGGGDKGGGDVRVMTGAHPS